MSEHSDKSTEPHENSQLEEEKAKTGPLVESERSFNVQESSGFANVGHVRKRFSASAYMKYFSFFDDAGSLKVQCKATNLKKGNICGETTECACGSVFTLQKDTYSNLKRHLEQVHKIKSLEPLADQSSGALKQPTLAEFKESNTKYPSTNLKQLQFERDILDCFALDGMPFETVDKPGFVKLVNGLDKRINVHNRTYFMLKLRQLVSQEIVPRLKNDLQKIEKRFCHFSCDVWTSRTGEGILCILAHFVDNSWNLQKRVLHYEPLIQRHTGDHIRGVFLKCLADFGVPSNWGGFVVTDNASNMKKAFNLECILEDDEWARLWSKEDIFSEDVDGDVESCDDFSEEINDPTFLSSLILNFSDGLYDPRNDLPVHGHLSCAAHTLQLAINDSIRSDTDSKDFLKYINKIMVFFKRSTRWRDELRNYCKDSPRMYCVTRWNSYLDMIKRFEKDDFFSGVRNVLDRAALDHESNKAPDAPAVTYQPKARELGAILFSIAYATDKLQSESCTSNLLIPVITTAFRNLSKLQPIYYESLQKAVLQNIKSRMEPIIKRNEYILATLLDPRIKKSVFCLSWPNAEYLDLPTDSEVMDILRNEYRNWTSDENRDACAHEDMSTLDLEEDPLFSMLSEVPKSSALTCEIDQYLSEPRSPTTSCPLKFWESNSNRFVVLARIARKYLAIPASSAGVERIFSITGWLSRARRASISSDNISRLLLVREEVQRHMAHRGLKRKSV